MAVRLQFHMDRKNHYNLIVFLDKTGRAEVGRGELLRSAREDAASFLMDYVDLAAGYAGRITVEVLGPEAVERALDAYAIYKKMFKYPAGYREALLRARRFAASKEGCEVAVEQFVDTAPRPH